MTVLMITSWLALQIPAGMAIGRLLQNRLVPLPVRARRLVRR